MKNENFPLVRIYSYWLRTRRDPRGILILDVGANFTLLPYRVVSCHPALQMWKELFRERTYATTAAICEFIEISSCRIRRWLHVYHGRVVIARLSYEWNGSGSTDSIPASENWGLNEITSRKTGPWLLTRYPIWVGDRLPGNISLQSTYP